MTEPTEITTLQKRINTLAGLIDELKQLYIKVGVMYVPTNGDTLVKNKDGKYPLYISRQAAEKDYPDATVVELSLIV